jgi:cytochrome bd-type quinol oxidase subunit 1
MVGIGIFSIAMGLLGAFLLLTKKIYDAKLYLFVLPFLIPLPHIAHETGWISAEVGRQPWIIYGLMKTAHGASMVVSASDILGSLIICLFAAVYYVYHAVFKICEKWTAIIIVVNDRLRIRKEKRDGKYPKLSNIMVHPYRYTFSGLFTSGWF